MFNTTTTMYSNYWVAPISVKRVILPDRVLQAACAVFNVPKMELVSKRKTDELVRARYISMYILRHELKLTVKKIGQIFNRHHTTVLHALITVNDELYLDHTQQQCEEDIKKVLNLIK